jgi:hypothetical protein
MQTKTFLFVTMILFSSVLFYAQEKSLKVAFSGANGIFVYTGLEITFVSASKTIPFKYKIERSEVGRNQWTEITQISVPDNFEEFTQNIYKLNRGIL